MDPTPEKLLRETLRAFKPYKPGTSVDEVRRKFGIEHPVKLSQNENPLGTSPRRWTRRSTAPGLGGGMALMRAAV